MLRKIFLLLTTFFVIGKYKDFDRPDFVEIERFIFAESKYFPDAVKNETPINKNDAGNLSKAFVNFKKEYKSNGLKRGDNQDIYQNYLNKDDNQNETFKQLLTTFRNHFDKYYEIPDDTYEIIMEDENNLAKKIGEIKVEPVDTKLKPLWGRGVKVLFLLLKTSKAYAIDGEVLTKSTFIGLKEDRYSTPSVRFREQYYWDTYFQMVGFLAIGEMSEVVNMLDNFMKLIEDFNFIPNANRTYYKNRSQPPLFGLMVKEFLGAGKLNVDNELDYLGKLEKALKQELETWSVLDKHSVNIVVDGVEYDLHRYYVDEDKPRLEGFKEDLDICIDSLRQKDKNLKYNSLEELCLAGVDDNKYKPSKELMNKHGSTVKSIYSNIAASCESGFDFSTKNFPNNFDENQLNKDLNKQLDKLVTMNMAPVELQVYLIILREARILIAQKRNEIYENLIEQDLIDKMIAEKNQRISDFVKVFYNSNEQQYFDRFWVKNHFTASEQGLRLYGINQIVPTLIDWESYRKTKTDDLVGGDIDHKANLKKFHLDYGLEESKWLVKTSHYSSKLNWDNNYWPPVIYFHFRALLKHGLNDEAYKLKNSYIFNFVNISNFINDEKAKNSGEKYIKDFMIEKMMGSEARIDFMDKDGKENRLLDLEFQKGNKFFELKKNSEKDQEGEYERQLEGGFGWTVGTIVSMLMTSVAEPATPASQTTTSMVKSGSGWKVILAVAIILIAMITIAIFAYYKYIQVSRAKMNRRRRKNQVE